MVKYFHVEVKIASHGMGEYTPRDVLFHMTLIHELRKPKFVPYVIEMIFFGGQKIIISCWLCWVQYVIYTSHINRP